MLATAPAPVATAISFPPAIRTDLVLPRTITVCGRICSPPTLSFTITGAAVAHFLLDCDDLSDLRMQRLAHRGSSIVDVTVWGPDATFVAHGPRRGFRTRLNKAAEAAGEPARWGSPDIESEFAPPIRQHVRIAVHGTPRRGLCYPIGLRGRPLALGLVAEGLPRVIGPELRA